MAADGRVTVSLRKSILERGVEAIFEASVSVWVSAGMKLF
jgi:hypothetical protein